MGSNAVYDDESHGFSYIALDGGMVTHFIEYQISGHVLNLEVAPTVFKPTSTSQFLAEQLDNLNDKIVLDLGCGVGPIAIAAALNGAGRVYAVDLMPEACELARRNIKHNGVSNKVTVLQGNLFEPLKGITFDIIVDDVSGMAEEVARLSSWYPNPIPTGGPDGTLPTVTMLVDSPSHLNDGGCLFFPVLSLANSEKIMSVARMVYGDNLQLVSSRLIPFNKELQSHIELLQHLKEQNYIHFVQNRSRYLWNLEIYRANA